MPRYCFVIWCLIIIWAPLPFGSYWPWALYTLILATGLLTVVVAAEAVRQNYPLFQRLKPFTLPLALLFLVPVWASLQLLPLPWSLLSTLSPRSAEIWQASGADFGRITLDVGRSQTMAAWSWALWFFLALSFVLLDSRERVKTAGMVIVYCGAFQALYGSFMTLSGLEYGFFVNKTAYVGTATGTFSTRNVLAGYLGMCLSTGIGLLVGSMRRRSSASGREKLRQLLDSLLGSKLRVRVLLFLMVIALVLTRSRMGNTAFFSSLCLTAAIMMLMERRLYKSSLILFGSMLLIDFFIVGQWFGFEELAQRLQDTSVNTDVRDEVARDTWTMIRDFPLTGSGLGSNLTVFPQFQGADVRMYMEHTHNDYLEFAADLGIIGIVPLGLFILLSLGCALQSLYKRHDQRAKGLAFGAAMSIIALLIHSTVDFNFQIPASALLFMVVIAFAWISRTLPRRNR